jgi:cytochrome c-type biogenesis protein CcmH
MSLFYIYAALLLGVAAILVVPPLWFGQRKQVGIGDRKEMNLAIFGDHLADLERERSAGTLTEAEFAQAKDEIQRRMLDEIQPDGTAPSAEQGRSRQTAIALLLLIPLLTITGYLLLGNPKALDPVQAKAPQAMTPEQIEGMVARLAARLEANPDDPKGWLMLARSYKNLGRYGDAANAYGKAEKMVNEDPELLANYAEALAMAAGKGLKGKPLHLVERALKLDPNNGHALFLAGAAAMEVGNNKKGIAYWEALLPQVEPGSDIDRMLRSGIEQMKSGKK